MYNQEHTSMHIGFWKVCLVCGITVNDICCDLCVQNVCIRCVLYVMAYFNSMHEEI
jgi:hypothetical protein